MKQFIVGLSVLGLFLSTTIYAQITYTLVAGNESWPAEKRDAIVQAMDEAVAFYNAHGYFVKALTVDYNTAVPTADANYSGRIRFGGSISTRTALHEISHTQGVGTYWKWSNLLLADNNWAGAHANARIKLYNGDASMIKTAGVHFWSASGPTYGLNYPREDGSTNRIRHVRVVSALRWDMGIVKDSDNDGMPDDWEMFYFKNLSQTGTTDYDVDGVSNLDEYKADKNPSSKFEWIKVDDRNASVSYDTNWGEWPSDPSYNTTVNFSEITGASVTYNFEGTKVKFYGFKRNDLGFADIYIDDVLQTSVDCYGVESEPDVLLYESDELDYGSHTLKVVVSGSKNESSSGTEIIVDAFEYYEGELSNPISENYLEDEQNILNVFPNPAKDGFTVKAYTASPAKVSIFTMQGELVYENTFTNSIQVYKDEISVTGLVLVKLKIKGDIFVERLFIE